MLQSYILKEFNRGMQHYYHWKNCGRWKHVTIQNSFYWRAEFLFLSFLLSQEDTKGGTHNKSSMCHISCLPCAVAAAVRVQSTSWSSREQVPSPDVLLDDTDWPEGYHEILAFLPAHFLPCTIPKGPSQKERKKEKRKRENTRTERLRRHKTNSILLLSNSICTLCQETSSLPKPK